MSEELVASLLAECQPVAEAFEATGHHLYLVGGIVRDLVGGFVHADPDFDFTTDATPDLVKALLEPLATAIWTQGERFGTIAAWVGGRRFEITTHRADFYDPDSRKPQVTFSDRIETDLSRRDFTINAMALEVTGSDHVLIDPFDGRADLAAALLRTPLGPQVSFADDPLRMLRAARFIARFGADPDTELIAAATEMSERLSVVSAERIRAEFDHLLGVADPSAGLDFLIGTGLAPRFFGELVDTTVPAIAAVTAEALGGVSPVGARLAALFVSGLADESTAATHERCSARMRSLKYPTSTIQHVERLVRAAEVALDLVVQGDRGATPSEADLRRLVAACGPVLEHGLTVADAVAFAASESRPGVTNELRRALESLAAVEDLSRIEPGLDGSEIIGRLGVPPGPAVGEALRFLFDLRIDEGPLGREELLNRLDQWWAARR